MGQLMLHLQNECIWSILGLDMVDACDHSRR